MNYNDDLDLSGPLIEGPKLAAKVRAAIEAQKNGPLPHWIRAPKPRHKEEPDANPGWRPQAKLQRKR